MPNTIKNPTGSTRFFGTNGSAITTQPVVKGARIVLATDSGVNKRTQLGISTTGTSINASTNAIFLGEDKAKNNGLVDFALFSGAVVQTYDTTTVGNRIQITFDADVSSFLKPRDFLFSNKGVLLRVHSVSTVTLTLTNLHFTGAEAAIFNNSGNNGYFMIPTNKKIFSRSLSRQIVRGVPHSINLPVSFSGPNGSVSYTATQRAAKYLDFGSKSNLTRGVDAAIRTRTPSRDFITKADAGTISTTSTNALRSAASATITLVADASIRSKRTTFALGGKPSIKTV